MPDNNESNDVYGTAQYIFFKHDILRRSRMLTLCRVCDRRINEDRALVELHSQGEAWRTRRIKDLSQCHSVHNYPLRTGLGLSPVLHGERPEINRPRYCTVGWVCHNFTKQEMCLCHQTHLHITLRLRMGGAMPLFALYSFLTWIEINLPFPLMLSNPCFRVLGCSSLHGAQSFRINSRSVDQQITSFLWSCTFITSFGRALRHINPVHTLVC